MDTFTTFHKRNGDQSQGRKQTTRYPLQGNCCTFITRCCTTIPRIQQMRYKLSSRNKQYDHERNCRTPAPSFTLQKHTAPISHHLQTRSPPAPQQHSIYCRHLKGISAYQLGQTRAHHGGQQRQQDAQLQRV